MPLWSRLCPASYVKRTPLLGNLPWSAAEHLPAVCVVSQPEHRLPDTSACWIALGRASKASDLRNLLILLL